jgi:D-arabinan exo alpha-(1,3)/(1,5)-arabinofuranosidase (non-reducing end)
MRPFLVFVLSFAFVPMGVSAEVSSWLSNLPTTRDYVQKRASSYDRSGGNFDLRRLPAGETLTLMDDSGPGIITHIGIR